MRDILGATFIAKKFILFFCFFDRDLEGLNYRNIEIEILIPRDNEDGIALIGDDMSFSPGQTEYLINKSNLSKVIDVCVDGEKAYIKMVYIPTKIWDKNYKQSKESSVIR